MRSSHRFTLTRSGRQRVRVRAPLSTLTSLAFQHSAHQLSSCAVDPWPWPWTGGGWIAITTTGLNRVALRHRKPAKLLVLRRTLSVAAQTRMSSFLFRQLFDRESCTYTYLLADTDSKEAVLIDPVIELAQRDKQVLEDLGLSLVYAINTHMHADHITGTGLLKKLMPPVKSVISTESGAASDVKVTEGDKIKFGKHELEVRSTPGHTSGCVAYVSHAERCVFTGDALLIRGCGRTDFQEGDAGKLYDNVWNKILSLPENYTVYPAHDYKGHTKTSVAEEKRLNPRLTKTRAEFVELMGNLGLAYPKKIDIALPANKVCGLYDLPDNLKDLLK